MSKTVVWAVVTVVVLSPIAMVSYGLGYHERGKDLAKREPTRSAQAVIPEPDEEAAKPKVSTPGSKHPDDLVYTNNVQEVPADYEDGPGPGYVGDENGMPVNSPTLPEGLTMSFGSNGDTIERPVWLDVGFKNQGSRPTPGGTQFKVSLDPGLVSTEGGTNSTPFIYAGCLSGPHYPVRLLSSGFTVPRLLMGNEVGVFIDVKLDPKNPPVANPTSPIMAYLWIRGSDAEDWRKVSTCEWWY